MLGPHILFLDYHLSYNINMSDLSLSFFRSICNSEGVNFICEETKEYNFFSTVSYFRCNRRIDFNHVLDFFTLRKTFASIYQTPLFLNLFFY